MPDEEHKVEPGAEIGERLDGVRILIIDDDPTDMLLPEETLTEEGASVETMFVFSQDNIEAVVRKLKEGGFNVLLTDGSMGNTTGAEVATAARSADYQGVIVAHTGNPNSYVTRLLDRIGVPWLEKNKPELLILTMLAQIEVQSS